MSEAMTEFRITTNLDAIRGQIIEANFEEVRDWLDRNLEPYRSMDVTPDGMAMAKSYRANIRKVRDRIDASRKEAKNAALAAYTSFEAKCKELTGLCDDAANSIDSQIKAFEDAEKQKKIDALRAEYDAINDAEAKEYCPWELVYNDRWGNKGYRFEDAVEEIKAAINTTQANLGSIRLMDEQSTPYLLDIYKQTHDFNLVFRKSIELKEAREREEQRRREEAQRQAQTAPKPVEEKAQETKDEDVEVDASVETQQPDLVTVAFKVVCTKKQLAALGQYMRENGIKYGRA